MAIAVSQQAKQSTTRRFKIVPVDEITIGKRHRKDMGDLESLAASINEEGLLQPIGVTVDNELIFGERRLRTVRDVLGWDRIQVQIIDISSIAAGEFHENQFRKDFTVSERVAIAEAIKAEIGDRQGKRTDLDQEEDDDEDWQPVGESPRENQETGTDSEASPGTILQFPRTEVGPGQQTRDIAAAIAGLPSVATYERAKQVVESGSSALIEAMDAEEIPVTTAWKLLTVSKKEQTRLAKAGKKAIREALAPPPSRYPASDRFVKAMGELSALVEEVRQDYGTIPKMLKHKGWNKRETVFAEQWIEGFAVTFSEMKKELDEHRKQTRNSSQSK